MTVAEVGTGAPATLIPSLRRGGSNAVESAVSALNRSTVGTVGVERFGRYVVVVVSGFGVLYALQTLPEFIAGIEAIGGVFGVLTVVSIWGSALLGPVAAVCYPHHRLILSAAVAAYALGIAVWPLAIAQPIPTDPLPWPVAVAAVPLMYLAVASRSTVVSIGIGLVFAAQDGATLVLQGGQRIPDVTVGFLLMVMLTVVFTLVIATLRSGVRSADRARATVLAEYAARQTETATEAERRRTDALLHDAVLTTFLTAASVQTPEAEDLASRMAANAVRVLAHVNRSAEYGPVIPFADAWAAVEQRLAPLISLFEVDDHGSGTVILPAEIADTMLEAMADAMAISVRYAEAQHRELRLAPLGPDGLRIVVSDDGVGFDLAAAQLRAMADAVQVPLRRYDGRADIDTSPGKGCTVVLSWGSVVMSGTDPLPSGSGVTA